MQDNPWIVYPLLKTLTVCALVALGSVARGEYSVSVADCKQVRKSSGYMGRFGWEDAPAHAIVAASEASTRGHATLTCSWRLPSNLSTMDINVGRLHISFTGGPGSGNGVVLSLSVDGREQTRQRYLRSAGEDWIETGPKTYSLRLPTGSKRLELVLELVDTSQTTATRVDIDSVSLTASPSSQAAQPTRSSDTL